MALFARVGEGWDGPGLGSADLTFYFGTPTLDFPLDLQHAALINALDVWASVAALTFTEVLLAFTLISSFRAASRGV
jgi:hypothetical protein